MIFFCFIIEHFIWLPQVALHRQLPHETMLMSSWNDMFNIKWADLEFIHIYIYIYVMYKKMCICFHLVICSDVL